MLQGYLRAALASNGFFVAVAAELERIVAHVLEAPGRPPLDDWIMTTWKYDLLSDTLYWPPVCCFRCGGPLRHWLVDAGLQLDQSIRDRAAAASARQRASCRRRTER